MKFVPISKEGVHEGDFTMMMGYPGQTSRYVSFSYLKYLHDYYYPFYLDFSRRRIEITEKLMAESQDYAVRLADRWSGFSNFYKKAKGIMKGFKKADVLAKKELLENQLLEYIKNNNLSEKYGHVIPQLDNLYNEELAKFKHNYMMGTINYTSDYLGIANRIVKWAAQQEKPDSERKKGYQERDRASQIRSLKRYQPNLLPVYEKEILYFIFKEVTSFEPSQSIGAISEKFDGLDSTALREQINEMVDNTKLGNLDERLLMFEMSLPDLKKLNDPMIDLALAMRNEFEVFQQNEEIYDAILSKLTPQLISAYLEFQPGNNYPDANSTKRFNFGQVMGYSPADGVEYKYYTTFKGMIDKETGENPFVVPEQIKAVYNSKDYGNYYDSTLGDVPVNILVSNNGTNGSSGSSVLNGKGELVGLDFDTNFDGVIADYWYDPSFCRSITVSSRYMLFLIDQVYHLDGLLKELTIH